MKNEKKEISKVFQGRLKGIVIISGGLWELFWTKFNLVSLLITVFILSFYFLSVDSLEQSHVALSNLTESGVAILGSIVGLSLAGLTLIIAFSNTALISNSITSQLRKYLKDKTLTPSYFQKAVAKFSFIVLFQIMSLIFFLVINILCGYEIKSNSSYAFGVNKVIYTIALYFMIFSLVLVVASIVNLFTISQTSNFLDFMESKPKESKSSDEKEE